MAINPNQVNFNEVYSRTTQQPNRSSNLTNAPRTQSTMRSGPVDAGTTVNQPAQAMLPQNSTPAEYSKFLYDSGLQNIFNDYQQNITTLNQQEQKQLQDAYYVRELSRKYLGEYASNVGIGDVSGNLLDIFSQYQQNIGQIQGGYDQMALNLQQTFQQQSTQNFQQAVDRQVQIQNLELQENEQSVLVNIGTGQTNGQDWWTYLAQQRDSGEITEASYTRIYGIAYQSNLETLTTNLGSGFFGFKTDEDGNRVLQTPEEYLEQNRAWLSDRDYQALSDRIEGGSNINVQTEITPTFNVPQIARDLFGFDANSFESTITIDGQSTTLLTLGQNVDQEGFRVSSSELFEKAREDGRTLVSGQTFVEIDGEYFLYVQRGAEGGNWFRAINTTALNAEIAKWTDPKVAEKWVFSGRGQYILSDGEEGSTGPILNLTNDKTNTTITYQGFTFENDTTFTDGKNGFEALRDSGKQNEKAIYDAYKAIHGENAKENAVFFHNGSFYMTVKRGNRFYFRKFTKRT
jgi:hypothetical protein